MSDLDKAISFATNAHSGQVRKLANTPYILHPFEVASIIGTMTDDVNVIIAGLLHDTIEDCGIDPRIIREEFGPRVAALVQGESEDKTSNKTAEETWMARKEESLLMLKHTNDIGIKTLWLGDKLSNIRSFYREKVVNGRDVFSHLHQKDPKMHQWYYETIAEYTKELENTAAYKEYIFLVNEVFK